MLTRTMLKGTGTDDIYVSSLWYYDLLAFLKDQEQPIEGECIGIDCDIEDDMLKENVSLMYLLCRRTTSSS